MAESQVPLSSPLMTRRNQAAFVRPNIAYESGEHVSPLTRAIN